MVSKNQIPRVLAVHDLSCLGRVALMVVIPILSAMGIQVNPLPTALLSSSTNFKRFKIVDLTSQMEDFIQHWKDENIVFDTIYTGFLGSAGQIKIVKNLIDYYQSEKCMIVIDPVLGDDGCIYSTMKQDNIDGMKELIKSADLITPNITEACLLLDEPFQTNFTTERIMEFAHSLSDKGPKTVVITGVNNIEKLDITSVIAYSSKDNSYHFESCEYIPARYPGTGDIFTSILIGCLLSEIQLSKALVNAVNFTAFAIKETITTDYDINEGATFEKAIKSNIFCSF